MGTQERQVHVFFEVDVDTEEATGMVHFYCSDECRSADGVVTPEDVKLVPGETSIVDVPDDMHCETCSGPLDEPAA